MSKFNMFNDDGIPELHNKFAQKFAQKPKYSGHSYVLFFPTLISGAKNITVLNKKVIDESRVDDNTFWIKLSRKSQLLKKNDVVTAHWTAIHRHSFSRDLCFYVKEVKIVSNGDSQVILERVQK